MCFTLVMVIALRVICFTNCFDWFDLRVFVLLQLCVMLTLLVVALALVKCVCLYCCGLSCGLFEVFTWVLCWGYDLLGFGFGF